MISNPDVTFTNADLPKELWTPQSVCIITYYPFADAFNSILLRFCADRPCNGTIPPTITYVTYIIISYHIIQYVYVYVYMVNS